MDIYVLSSGSCGNCTFVRSGSTRILIDAGLPGSTTKRFLGRVNENLEAVDAVLLTHEHRDHPRGAGVLSRQYGTKIYGTRDTFEHSNHITNGIAEELTRPIQAGETFSIGEVEIEPVSTPHDAVNSVGYVLDTGGARFGVFTDIGRVFEELTSRIESFDAMMLETNYDVDMLDNGPYPEFLKERIRGGKGHLSNDEAAGLLAGHANGKLTTVFLSHLSEENNRPELVTEALHNRLDPDTYERMDFIMTRRGFPVSLVTLKEARV